MEHCDPACAVRSDVLTLFKLKTGQLLNLDQVVRVSPQIDPVTKKDYMDVDLGGVNVSIKDEDDLAAFAVVTGRLTPSRT